jgi:hypothetical protein
MSYNLLIIIFINITIDIFLKVNNFSWSYILYENTLVFSSLFFNVKYLRASAILITAYLSLFKFLFFIFGLKIQYLLDVEIFLFVLASCIIVSMWLITKFSFYRLKKYYYIPVFFLIITYVFDKNILNDHLASQFTTHFLRFSSEETAEPSTNIVYKSVINELGNGNGVTLIVWESLGALVKDKYILESINSNIQESEILFEGGSTVSAEIRYLCGSNNGFFRENCIPNIFNGGMAYHGNSLNYFARYIAYKEYGFTEFWGFGD